MLTHPMLEKLCDWWWNQRGGRPLPAWQTVELADLDPWLAHLVLVEVASEGEFRARPLGQSGACHPELVCGPDLSPTAQADLAKVCLYRAPLFVRRPIDAPRYSELLLPMAEDGEIVDRLLVSFYPLALLH